MPKIRTEQSLPENGQGADGKLPTSPAMLESPQPGSVEDSALSLQKQERDLDQMRVPREKIETIVSLIREADIKPRLYRYYELMALPNPEGAGQEVLARMEGIIKSQIVEWSEITDRIASNLLIICPPLEAEVLAHLILRVWSLSILTVPPEWLAPPSSQLGSEWQPTPEGKKIEEELRRGIPGVGPNK